MEFPGDVRYSRSHEWVRIDGPRMLIGITDYAQDALGDIVYVSQPVVGTTVAEGDPVAEVESTKSVSDIYAPVAGTIVAINEALGGSPELVNKDPFGEGWIFAVEPAGGDALGAMLDAQAYQDFVSKG